MARDWLLVGGVLHLEKTERSAPRVRLIVPRHIWPRHRQMQRAPALVGELELVTSLLVESEQ